MADHDRNGGDVVVETLTALGVSHVFGIPGQHALGLFDAIRRSNLRFVSSRVENNSAFEADGYTRATGEVGVLFLSTGPGALTALGALQEAYATGVPLLVITSQVPRAGLGLRKGMLHQLDDQQAQCHECHQEHRRRPRGRRDPQSAGRRVGAGPVRPGRTHLGRDPRGCAAGGHPRPTGDVGGDGTVAERPAAQPNSSKRLRPCSIRRIGRSSWPAAVFVAPPADPRRWSTLAETPGRARGLAPSAARALYLSTIRCPPRPGSRIATPPSCSRTPTCCSLWARRWVR